MAATVLALEAKRLEVLKRRNQLQLSQMVGYEMDRKQMQARGSMHCPAIISSYFVPLHVCRIPCKRCTPYGAARAATNI